MARNKRSNKRQRGSRGSFSAPCLYHSNTDEAKNKKHTYYDLMVPLPKATTAVTGTSSGRGTTLSSSSRHDNGDSDDDDDDDHDNSFAECQILLRQLIERYITLGYTTIALTHTIYGRPNIEKDMVQDVFSSLYDKIIHSYRNKLTILKRLHAVIENSSDLSIYATTSFKRGEQSATVINQKQKETIDLLGEYDLVSVSPRNDSVFQALCRSFSNANNSSSNNDGTIVDIITLDYTAGRGNVQLPFKIRSSDIKEITKSQQQQQKQRHPIVAFEVLYSTAILNINQRKALVQTCREMQMSVINNNTRSTSKLLPVILCSGYRSCSSSSSTGYKSNKDVGSLAIRSYGDLINILKTVLMFDNDTSYNAVCQSCCDVITYASMKRNKNQRNNNNLTLAVASFSTTSKTTNNAHANDKIVLKINENDEISTYHCSDGDDDDNDKLLTKKIETQSKKKQKVTPAKTTIKNRTKSNNDDIRKNNNTDKKDRRLQKQEKKKNEIQNNSDDHDSSSDSEQMNEDKDDDNEFEDGFIKF